jgi:hypothetical protein
MKSKNLTREEKYAKELEELLSDIRLDIDLLGLYFYQFARKIAYHRLEALLDSIREQVYTSSMDKHQKALEKMWQEN